MKRLALIACLVALPVHADSSSINWRLACYKGKAVIASFEVPRAMTFSFRVADLDAACENAGGVSL